MKKINIYIVILLTIILPINIYALPDKLIPGGETIGININSDGIMVIGFYEINGKLNKGVPNLKVGDSIKSVGDTEINTVDELIDALNKNMTDNKARLNVLRNGKSIKVTLDLIYDEGTYKTGLYVKDSITGIGTLSYIDPSDKSFGALGHPIIESNSGKKIEIRDGSIFKSVITGIERSSSGSPGGKDAKLIKDVVYGDISKNSNFGIYGTYNASPSSSETVKVKGIDEIKRGNAYIYTVIDKDIKEKFDIDIKKVSINNSNKDIVFEVTDKKLLEKTGGIVQGMSGSPIMQDGAIIGAVTYVDVSNPKIGYGISINKMLNMDEK